MIRVSPPVRISLSLVLMTISLLLAGNYMGLGDGNFDELLKARQELCEGVALQVSSVAARDNADELTAALESLVGRHDKIVSGALRRSDGVVVAQAGDHVEQWSDAAAERSTPTHARVPVFADGERWGDVEVVFLPLSTGSMLGLGNEFLALLGFVALVGFAAYLLLMRRTLRALDPSAVVPARVKTALDCLEEGVVLVDEEGSIVLANASFAQKVGTPVRELLGLQLQCLGWLPREGEGDPACLPWEEAARQRTKCTGVSLSLKGGDGRMLTFMVNSTPILDAGGGVRGAMASFDDVTELEGKNSQLREMLVHLEESQASVRQQNEELQVLARQDPLTGLANRRALFDQFELLFSQSKRNGNSLTCVMTDIDHFKSVNDDFGHTMGDTVLREVSRILKDVVRGGDIVGRYGGEEFCIVLAEADSKLAMIVIERMRARIAPEIEVFTEGALGRPITLSFGIAEMDSGSETCAELVERADKALYVAKETGRDRAACFSEIATLLKEHEPVEV